MLFGADQAVGSWMGRRLPDGALDPKAKYLGLIVDKRMAGAVAYQRFNGVHCEAAIVIENGRALTRSALHAIFFYPFNTMQAKAISVMVPSTNLQSLNLATKLGFTPEALIEFAAHDGSTLVVLKMFRDQCRWIENGQGQFGATGT